VATGSAPAAKRNSAKARGKRFEPGRWGKVALLLGLVFVGLPLAHGMFGEVAALLGGAVIFGFLLGRWTAR